jgi:hypothetical protein
MAHQIRAQKFCRSIVDQAACGVIAVVRGAGVGAKVLQLAYLPRTAFDRFSSTAEIFFMVHESARFPGKCTIAVQLATPSITSVFQKQSVVKDRLSRQLSLLTGCPTKGCE